MLLTFGKNLIKPVPFSSPWEQVPEPAYIYIYIYIYIVAGRMQLGRERNREQKIFKFQSHLHQGR
jgi:uncharacterized membrane protein SirB2